MEWWATRLIRFFRASRLTWETFTLFLWASSIRNFIIFALPGTTSLRNFTLFLDCLISRVEQVTGNFLIRRRLDLRFLSISVYFIPARFVGILLFFQVLLHLLRKLFTLLTEVFKSFVKLIISLYTGYDIVISLLKVFAEATNLHTQIGDGPLEFFLLLAVVDHVLPHLLVDLFLCIFFILQVFRQLFDFFILLLNQIQLFIH